MVKKRNKYYTELDEGSVVCDKYESGNLGHWDSIVNLFVN